MTYDDVLDLCSVATDPDDFVRLVAEVLALRWSDETAVVRLQGGGVTGDLN